MLHAYVARFTLKLHGCWLDFAVLLTVQGAVCIQHGNAANHFRNTKQQQQQQW